MIDALSCKKCGGDVYNGIALIPTVIAGLPDFENDTHASTFSFGGPGELVRCLKCIVCGHSFGFDQK